MTTEPLLADLRAATVEFLATLGDLTPAQWIWKPEPATWSVQEIAEHTCAVQKGVERLFTTRLLDQPLTDESPPLRWSDAEVMNLFKAARPARAPEMVHPKGRWTTQEEIAAAFTASVDKLSAWVRATRADLRAYGSIHPLLGMMDGVQWLLFAPAHARHHGRQVMGLRGRVGFPGGRSEK
jgi:hypothetical protein